MRHFGQILMIYILFCFVIKERVVICLSKSNCVESLSCHCFGLMMLMEASTCMKKLDWFLILITKILKDFDYVYFDFLLEIYSIKLSSPRKKNI